MGDLMASIFAQGESTQEIDMPNDIFNTKDTLGLSKGEGVAIYQIRRAIAQLEDDKIPLSDAAESVLAQLRAYLESIDNEQIQ